MSAPQFTSQQAAAVHLRGVSVALSAGAGCGKTFVLTQRFLSHLEPTGEAADLRSLVAITFTDRAAREMRDRIRAACQARLETCPAAEVDHWLGILRGLDTARISTIHSFCNSLLRSHAVEARLDPRFALLEPALATSLLNNSAKEVLHEQLVADDAAAGALVLKFGLERTTSLVAELASQRFRVDWSQFDGLAPEALADRWRQYWQDVLAPRLIRDFRTGELAQRVCETLRQSTTSHRVMRARCEELLTRLTSDAPWSDPQTELAAIREVAKVQGGGGKKDWSSEDAFEAVRDVLKELRDECDRLGDWFNISDEDLRLAAEIGCHALRLARLVAERYTESKRAAGMLDFDDLLLLARNLLRDRDDVCRRFATGIRLLMVDEFQDTDPVQADIVRALCGAALTQGKLFTVGDIKQSIYRFRRADPGVFRSVREQLPAAGQLSLTTNFRSQPEILKFVNLLFRPAFGAQYEALEAFPDKQQSPTPTIEFLFATTDAAPQLDAVDEDQRVPADALRRREADWIARRIAALLADPTPRIRSRNADTGETALRRVEPRDIVVLFRALTNVQLYENALREYGLEYYLVGGKAFYAQQEVFDLLNLCRCLSDPDDAVSLLGVLRSPFFGLSDDALQALRPEDGDWTKRLSQPPPAFLPEPQRDRIRFADETLRRLRTLKDRIPTAELLTTALELTGYDAALLVEHLGRRKVANLRKLIDQATSFDQAEIFTLQDYVQRLEDSVLEETEEEFATTLPETGEVIRLMSVHQAKGLEFPVVILADVDRQQTVRTGNSYLHPEWGALVRLPDEFGEKRDHLGLRMLRLLEEDAEAEETVRLFYVATTRAADHLILSAGVEPDRPPRSPWMKLLSERFDLQTGVPRQDALLGTFAGAGGRHGIPDIHVHHAPPAAEKPKTPREQISLEQLLQRLPQADPLDPPASLRTYPPDWSAADSWSVSQLEAVAAQLAPPAAAPHAAGRATHDAATAEALGTLVHAVLERIDYAVAADWDAALATAARTTRIDLTPTLHSAAVEILARFSASPLAQSLAQARRLLRETDFLLPWTPAAGEAAVITGAFDCLYEDEQGWHLLDFKTGDYPPAAKDAEILAPYELQLGIYERAVQAWLGEPLQSVALVLVRPTVRVVPLPQKAALRKRVQATVDRVIAHLRSGGAA